MLYTKKQLEVVKFASKDAGRYALNGVFLDPGGDTVATDAHILVKVTANGAGVNKEEFPSLKSGTPIDALPDDGIIIPADIVKDVIKNIPKGNGAQYLKAAALIKADDDAVSFATTTLEREKTETGKRIDGTFPKVDQVIPQFETPQYTRIGVNADYLADLAKFAARENGVVELHIPHDVTKTIVIKSVDIIGEEDIFGVLMPMLLPDKEADI